MTAKRKRDPFAPRPLLLGMVHLEPLPGAPGWTRARRRDARADPLHRAVRDAEALIRAGFDGVVVENHGDVPFHKDRVPPETVAAMAVAARAVRDAVGPKVSIGVNVLRNDAHAALAVAAAASLDFIRVNVLAGAAVTDQGVIEGRAAEVLRTRERLAPDVRILADLRVKHATPLGPRPLEEEAHDLAARGGADALALTGPRTGTAVDPEELQRVRAAVPRLPLLAASGVTANSVASVLRLADGVLVGTALKRGGRTDAPVDPRRAASFVRAARS